MQTVLRVLALLVPAGWICACGTASDHVHHHPAPAALEPLLETPAFELVDSHGRTVRSSDLAGKVWLVDFIFTRCTGPCPLMTQRMKTIQDSLREAGLAGPDAPVRLVSISVDPAWDTPPVLAEYAAAWQADTSNWDFLTGPPDETLKLIREGFKITADPEGSGSTNIVHSTSFLLVDQRGMVRRIYRMDEPTLEADAVEDIRKLLAEAASGN
ncbi:MAG: SCO family protein [Acidobacteriota bacterium]